MRRLVEQKLAAWKGSPERRPLLVRGARQVGKTWSVRELGREAFRDHIHILDLEQRPEARKYFEGDLNPRRVIAELELALDAAILPGRDLLFIDEIQACPRALLALRYFYEQMPELHVIAAGSLIEFALGAASFPVGRVDYLNLQPMTFVEYLWAIGRDPMAQLILAGPAILTETSHRLLLEELRRYLFVGGMPAAVSAYARTSSFQAAFERHDGLLGNFRDDFGKYAARANTRCLDEVFRATARSMGGQIKYARLAEGFKNDVIQTAFSLLEKAGVVRRVASASPAGLPLGASANPKRFKALMLDVGLLQRLLGRAPADEYSRPGLLNVFAGALAEQFVGQELAASLGGDIYCWLRPQKSSSAEVDFLVESGGRIVPIEVKSGPAGKLRSLHLLLREYPACAPGVVLSEAPFAELREQGLVFVPIYFAGSLGTWSRPDGR